MVSTDNLYWFLEGHSDSYKIKVPLLVINVCCIYYAGLLSISA